jgi:tetratricopeptide (TPR) repeat protein
MGNIFDYDEESGHEWDQAEKLAQEAYGLYEEGQMPQALEKLTQAIELGQENGGWFFNMGLVLDGMERYDQAITYFEKAMELMADDAEVMNCLGVDYTRTAQYDRAVAIFERIEQIDPQFEPAYCNRIITYTEMEQHEKAEQMFYLAQQIRTDCPLCFYNIGNSLFSRGSYERAIWCWEKTAELDPSHPQIHLRLAQAYWVCGKGKQARQEFLRELRNTPTDSDVLLDFGVFLLESGDIDAAREKFNRILEFDADFSAARFYLGEVHRLRGEMDAAIRQYYAVLTEDDQLIGPRYRLAELLQQQGQVPMALDLLREEYNLGVQDEEVLIAMGKMFLQMSDWTSATQCFLQTLDMERQEPRAFSGLGVALTLRGEGGAGLQCLEQALRLNDQDAVSLLSAAWICCRMKDWDAAAKYTATSRILRGRFEPYRTACKAVEKEIKKGQISQRWPLLGRVWQAVTHR